MNQRQKVLVGAAIFLPVVLGAALLLSGAADSRGASVLSAGGKKIGLVRIVDVIYSSEKYIHQLQEFRKDNSVAGVLLKIDSPGGAVAPSQEIFAEIMRFRTVGKPVVVSMENVAASGGYYIACAASRIYADPGTITGSFGVFMRFPHFYKLTEKLGVDMTTIKAGKFKDIGNPHREMTAEEHELLQGLIDDTHNQFIGDIARGRAMRVDSVRALADGRVFTGRRARELGLVDSLGGYDDALAYLKETLKLPESARVEENTSRKGLIRSLLIEESLGRLPILRDLLLPSGSYFLFQAY